ncbi:MAG: prolyl oligopeptidase family serine peptidase [Caulobacter sp.]
MVSRRGVIAGALVAPAALRGAVALAAEPAAAPVPPTLDELLRPAAVRDTALSPDGTQIAVLLERREGGKRIAYIILTQVDAIDQESRRVVLGDYDVDQVEWANDERLLIWLSFSKDADGKPAGIWYYDEFLKIPVKRVIAISLDGRNEVVLFNNQPKALKRDFNLARVVDMLPNDPRAVLMQMWAYGPERWMLHRVDVYTGAATIVERGSALTDFWFMQDGVPVLRYDSTSRATVIVLARAPGETDWKLLRKFRRNEIEKIEDFDVVAATAEPGVLLVAHRGENEDFKSIRSFDLRTLEMGGVVLTKPGKDLDFVFTDENQTVVGAAFTDDRLGYEFPDATLAAHFKGLNAFFKNTRNVVFYDVDKSRNRFLLNVTGPRAPGSFYFYNRETRALQNLADRRPWLASDRLADIEILKVTTRDGAPITAYLSLPLATGPRPLLVMPHGGPRARDSVDFDLWAQVFAAQGWLVLQPNFRGSDGYGKAFAEAGHKHWGDRMQEDVEDCIAHVMASGRVDPSRVAILGASYGGYAALMGGIRRPELYRCIVAIAADSDLIQSLAFSRRTDGADSDAYAYWKSSMGDPKTDEAMLRAASPALRADEFRAPVLLIHGTEDDIVTPDASRGMAKALKKAGKVHEHLELKGEGHRDWEADTLRTVLSRSIAFINAAFAAPKA